MADLGIHKTDLVQFLIGSRVDEVFSVVSTLDKRNADGTFVEVDDNAVCIYKMENGVVGTITVSWTLYGKEDNSTILYGTEGCMRILWNSLLNLNEPPTAVFAISDIVAIGAMQAIGNAGLHVPENIAVVGFDDLDIASLYNPPLTTVYQPKKDIGRLAMELLCKKIHGLSSENGSVFLEHELRIRKSTVK